MSQHDPDYFRNEIEALGSVMTTPKWTFEVRIAYPLRIVFSVIYLNIAQKQANRWIQAGRILEWITFQIRANLYAMLRK